METEQEVINEPSAGLYSTWGTEKESTNNTNDKTNTEELMMDDTILPATTIHSYDSTMEVKTLKDLKKTPDTVASKITIHINDLNPSPPLQILSTYALTYLNEIKGNK